jgi:hypothetical protein
MQQLGNKLRIQFVELLLSNILISSCITAYYECFFGSMTFFLLIDWSY